MYNHVFNDAAISAVVVITYTGWVGTIGANVFEHALCLPYYFKHIVGTKQIVINIWGLEKIGVKIYVASLPNFICRSLITCANSVIILINLKSEDS